MHRAALIHIRASLSVQACARTCASVSTCSHYQVLPGGTCRLWASLWSGAASTAAADELNSTAAAEAAAATEMNGLAAAEAEAAAAAAAADVNSTSSEGEGAAEVRAAAAAADLSSTSSEGEGAAEARAAAAAADLSSTSSEGEGAAEARAAAAAADLSSTSSEGGKALGGDSGSVEAGPGEYSPALVVEDYIVNGTSSESSGAGAGDYSSSNSTLGGIGFVSEAEGGVAGAAAAATSIATCIKFSYGMGRLVSVEGGTGAAEVYRHIRIHLRYDK